MPRIQPKHPINVLAGAIVILLITLSVLQIHRSTQLPVTLAYLDNRTLLFKCLNGGRCPQNINLETQVPPPKGPFTVGSVFYASPSSIFITLSFWDMSGSVLNVNPETSQIKYIGLPAEIEPGLSTIAHGRIVAGNRKGKLFIIQDDSSAEVELKLSGTESAIVRLIEAPSMRVIALNGGHIEESGKTFVEVFIVDVNTGGVEKRLLRSPDFDRLGPNEFPLGGRKYAGQMVNVSGDLQKLYYLYYLGKDDNQTDLTLGVFDVEALKETNSTTDVRCINMATGYSQYHGVLYSSRGFIEGSETATLIDMSDLKSIIDLREIVRNELTSKLIISPFGDDFLLGTNSRVGMVQFSR